MTPTLAEQTESKTDGIGRGQRGTLAKQARAFKLSGEGPEAVRLAKDSIAE